MDNNRHYLLVVTYMMGRFLTLASCRTTVLATLAIPQYSRSAYAARNRRLGIRHTSPIPCHSASFYSILKEFYETSI